VNRACFDQLQTENPIVWLVFDYICDFVYILDSCMRLRTGTDTHTHTHTYTQNSWLTPIIPKIEFIAFTHYRNTI